jgi:hypothetical protein
MKDVVQAMQGGVVSSGGSAFESMQKVMGDFAADGARLDAGNASLAALIGRTDRRPVAGDDDWRVIESAP